MHGKTVKMTEGYVNITVNMETYRRVQQKTMNSSANLWFPKNIQLHPINLPFKTEWLPYEPQSFSFKSPHFTHQVYKFLQLLTIRTINCDPSTPSSG